MLQGRNLSQFNKFNNHRTVDHSAAINLDPTPKHVAIIMDGNGRWARKRKLSRIEGHHRGVENVHNIVRAAGEMEIPYLTLYAFSVENWKRPAAEVEALMKLLELFLEAELPTLIERQIRLRIIGRQDDLPPSVRDALAKTVAATANHTRWNLILALNYGARSEVVDAVKSYAAALAEGHESSTDLTWERFAAHLYTAGIPDPDLIIRTSGERRLSNFLLLQSAYSEMYFTPTLWPDFGPDEFREAVQYFKRRERRFGQTGEQVQQAQSEPVLNR